jgi:hypothetical protein
MGLGSAPTFRTFSLAFCNASPGCRVGLPGILDLCLSKIHSKGLKKGTFPLKKTRCTEETHPEVCQLMKERRILRASRISIQSSFAGSCHLGQGVAKESSWYDNCVNWHFAGSTFMKHEIYSKGISAPEI